MTYDSGAFAGADVLVTGGAGAIGNRLVRELLNHDVASVAVLDDLSSGYRWLLPTDDRLTMLEGDVCDGELLRRGFKRDPEYVFHLAAHFANKNSVDHPETDLRINGEGTLKVLQHAQLTNPERFVYASSGCGIYGGDAEIPYDESDFTIEHDTPYQITKQLGEMYTTYFNQLYDLPIANARFFNSFGPGEVPGQYRNVIPNFFYWARQGQPLPITGDGSESRDWTYVADIVDGLLRMAVVDDAIGEAFNLATKTETRVIDMAEAINERTENVGNIEYEDRRNWDNKANIVGDNAKAKRVLGFDPQVDFETGLDEVARWFDTNWGSIEQMAEF
jgi:nucleoside-diphosphate-sugar epimerase